MPKNLHFLLADDDKDDRSFFEMVLSALAPEVKLTTVQDGEELMEFLLKNSSRLPDVLFLDINMPRKNGAECLQEIMQNEMLKALPVIMYSTSLHPEVAEQFHKDGAWYYIQKGDLNELERYLKKVLKLFSRGKMVYPGKDAFIIKTDHND
ncbi:MAG: response regulator rcp1 [Bacteroidetes bacterium]|nr:response regulator rcp1 [Bacteroidota bacterium]